MAGAWGDPIETLRRALEELAKISTEACKISHIYSSKPVGPANQPDYVNAVCQISSPRDASSLLAIFKTLEREAGRGNGRRWGPRPLDLDLIDFKGRVHQWPGTSFSGPRRRLVLPHPELHKRAFVLRPLLDVAPTWRHPVLGLSVRQILAQHPRDDAAMKRISTATLTTR